MKKLLILLYLVPPVFYADTYYYRVEKTRRTEAAACLLASYIESHDLAQPFSRTWILYPPNTNYYLLTVTPENGNDPELERFPALDLYQIKHIDEEGNWQNSIDNSLIYPVDTDWSVKRSS